MPTWIIDGLLSAKAAALDPKPFLLLNFALAFYNAGTI